MRVGDEECDDGNSMLDDGCTPTCREERGWTCDDNKINLVSEGLYCEAASNVDGIVAKG